MSRTGLQASAGRLYCSVVFRAKGGFLMSKKRFLIAIFIIALLGAAVIPLIGVWFPKISGIFSWFGYTAILIFSFNILTAKE